MMIGNTGKLVGILILLTWMALCQNLSGQIFTEGKPPFTEIFGNSIADFKKEFEVALHQDFEYDDFSAFYSKFPNFFWVLAGEPSIQTDQAEPARLFPLNSFKSDSVYQQGIKTLFYSDNVHLRNLAYLTIGSANDRTFEDQLLERLKDDKPKEVGFIGTALLFMGSDHTTPLFEYLVKYESFGDAHYVHYLFLCNKDSLRNTGQEKILSKVEKDRKLAASILAVTEPTPLTDSLLRQAFSEWPKALKGFAIHTLGELRSANLLEILKPMLENEKTRRVSLSALANSTSTQDQNYIRNLTSGDKPLSKDVLAALIRSKNSEFIDLWIEIIQTDRIADDYIVPYDCRKPLYVDELLYKIDLALPNIKSNSLKRYLGRELKQAEKLKIESLNIWFSPKVVKLREINREALRPPDDETIEQFLLKLLFNDTINGITLVPIIIDYKIDTLQEFFFEMYSNPVTREWRRAAFKYMATFPLEEYRKIFEREVQQPVTDLDYFRLGAEGLSKLGDRSWLDVLLIRGSAGNRLFRGKEAVEYRRMLRTHGVWKVIAKFNSETVPSSE